jgi:dienelactone hydrolase
MQEKRVERYGTWESAVTPELVAGATVGLSELAVDGEAVYWLEMRPTERGRRALVRWTAADGAADAVGTDADVGTRVHEYGGGAFAVRDGTIVYSDRSDGSVWTIEGSASPRLVTRVDGCRYAGFAIDPARKLAYAVREDHRNRPPTAPDNALVALSLDPLLDPTALDPSLNEGRAIASGTDFVLAPQLSPDLTHIAYIVWDQPNMPWDATRLMFADLTDTGTLENPRCIAGGAGGESIAEACWTPGGTLLFTSDRTNWWNVYAVRGDRIDALAPAAADFGEPHWVFGNRMLAPLDDFRIACAFFRNGVKRAGVIADGAVHELPLGAVDGAPLPFGTGAVYLRAAADRPSAICSGAYLDDKQPVVVRASSELALDPGDISVGEPGTVATDDHEIVHYVYYPPRSARITGPANDRPPLIVMSHGGPTSMHVPSFGIGMQWWTTRGFAVAHVNYRGSSGFGRAYRTRLNEAWGEVDVIDCISVARGLVAAGTVDPKRVAIRGGSSSGMTALLAVATSDVFSAAGSLYGVMELEALAADTHKFEARYTDGLIGPLPETRQRYIDRSPVNHVATIDAPVILFQGLDDRVVPPNQATAMRDALTARGVRVVYQAFEGEGHGFRKSDTIRTVMEMELAFYRDVFGLTA